LSSQPTCNALLLPLHWQENVRFCLLICIPLLKKKKKAVTKTRYAKSVFGEDALVNVCVERTTEGRIAGYIRIRSKTQGIALSLGDKITTLQKRV
jgi:hypothetical protein